jgi:biopolymer transport protein ExbB
VGEWHFNMDFDRLGQLIEAGGPVVLIIAFMSVIALTVALAKFLQFMIVGVGHGAGVRPALSKWSAADGAGALALVDRRRGVAAGAIACAMRHLMAGHGEAVAREDAAQVAESGLQGLRSYLRVLEATAQVAPLLGLFGTVIGMMGAFQALQAAGGDADPAALAGGIWVALITTAVGLAVAIPAGLALYWFEGRIERETVLAETALTRVFTASAEMQSAFEREASGMAEFDGAVRGSHAAE